MSKYIIDKIFFIIIGVGIMIVIPVICGPIFTALLEILVVLSWGYLCKPLLLLLTDLIKGSKEEKALFCGLVSIGDYEFFKGKHYIFLKFSLRTNDVITLLYPVCMTKEEIQNICLPSKAQKLKITFYNYSKVLIKWTDHTEE